MPAVPPAIFAIVAAADPTSTTSVPRVVGEPLPSWVVIAASAGLLVFILLAGLVARTRARRDEVD